jgi:hypothetical protein
LERSGNFIKWRQKRNRAGFRLSAADLIEVAEATERAWVSDGKCCLKDDLADLTASRR